MSGEGRSFDPISLAELLPRCQAGDRMALVDFYQSLLLGSVLIPSRFQKNTISNQARYPDDFFGLLALQGKEQVFIPVFTSEPVMRQWCPESLTYDPVSFPKLLARVPSDWWIVLNPGQEVEKEFSPWEIDLLRGGTGSIGELIDELLGEKVAGEVSIRGIFPSEFPSLQKEIVAYAAQDPRVELVYAAMEERGQNLEPHLILGVSITPSAAHELEIVRTQIQTITQAELIGDRAPRILIGMGGTQSVALGICRGLTPLYVGASTHLEGRFASDVRSLWHQIYSQVNKILGRPNR